MVLFNYAEYGLMVDWCRKVMDEETVAFVSRLPTGEMEALEVSGYAWDHRSKFKSYQTVHYPQFDLNYDIVPNQTFDIIFAEQVLEHVRYPYRAIRNIYRMLRPSGWFIVTTPFLIHIHMGKMDYTRWSPEGLKYLLEEGGFETEKMLIGSWGNRECAIADFNRCAEGNGWHVYDQNSHNLTNEPDYPIVVWAFAQRADY